MYFCHSDEIWKDYPELVPGLLLANGITKAAPSGPQTANFNAIAASRLAKNSEGELPEVQAWRRVFSRMGLKPTQHRCASESLLRRFRKEGSLPQLHPVIDLCNSISLAFAVPIAVFDAARIADHIEVRYANGSEAYMTLSGEIEKPEPGEVIFADNLARAHARRWTNRQSGYSAVRDETATVLIVAEGVHSSASTDIPKAIATIADELKIMGVTASKTGILNKVSPRFEF